jgi:hypothetical protein
MSHEMKDREPLQIIQEMIPDTNALVVYNLNVVTAPILQRVRDNLSELHRIIQDTAATEQREGEMGKLIKFVLGYVTLDEDGVVTVAVRQPDGKLKGESFDLDTDRVIKLFRTSSLKEGDGE